LTLPRGFSRFTRHSTIGSSFEAHPQREVEGKEWTSSRRNLEGICIGEEDRSYTFNFGYYDGRYHLHLDSFWKVLLFFPSLFIALINKPVSKTGCHIFAMLSTESLKKQKNNSYLYQLGGLFHLG